MKTKLCHGIQILVSIPYNILNKGIVWLCLVSAVVMIFWAPQSPMASDLADQFSASYESLTPSPNSSVQSDYLFQQIALGGDYTVRLLDQIYNQNSQLQEKYDQMLEKYDQIIENHGRIEVQNNEIISLLKKIAEK